MALTDKLSAIGDAIRSRTQKSGLLKLDEMPDEIRSLSTILLKPGEYPDYIRQEIDRVAAEVRSVLKDDSFVSICLSDSHYPADSATKASAMSALMGIKGLTHLIPVHYIAHLGDVGYEGPSSTVTSVDVLQNNLLDILAYIREVPGGSIPLFVAIGNHDSGNYITTSDNSDMVPGDWLYQKFTALADSDKTVFGGQSTGGYCYRDFADNKMRVFLLNTSEEIITGGYSNDTGTSVTQRAWLAQALQELNTKSDAAEWGFIILCHYPADYGASRTLSDLLAAYVNGTSITLQGTQYNFSGKNAARFVVQHHGHIHNFLHDKLYTGPLSSTPAQYEAWRVGIPNTQVNRENYYGEVCLVNYSQDKSYAKVPGTVKDTSFVVNVINKSEQRIYSFYYGVGINRAIDYSPIVYYTITNQLTNATSSNDSMFVEAGQSYSAIITIPENYEMKELRITMGGVDITTSVYDSGVINIPEVDGDVVVTANASKIPTSNLYAIAYSFEANSTEIYNNGLGYKNDCRLSGNAPDYWETDQPGCVLTGVIPWNRVDPISISGASLIEGNGYCKMFMTNAARDYVYYPWMDNGTSTPISTVFDITVIEEGNKYLLTPKSTVNVNSQVTHFAMSLVGSGEDLIVLIGDEAAVDYYRVTNNLTRVTTSNTDTKVDIGGTYHATLTPQTSYVLSSVTVTMGGVDVTSSVYTDGVISISKVTGSLVITASATVDTSSYTNWIPLSTDASGNPYNNGLGYKTGWRVNSSGVEKEASDMCLTGFMPVSPGDTIRLKNVQVASNGGYSTPYLRFYGANYTSNMAELSTEDMVEDTDGIITVTAPSASYSFFRASLGIIDDTSIITINQEILD